MSAQQCVGAVTAIYRNARREYSRDMLALLSV